MKVNKLTAAIVAASAFAASSAFAGKVVGVDPVGVEVTISGATAQDKGFSAVFAQLCTAGTLTTYTDICNGDETVPGGDITTCALTGPKQPGTAYSAYFCQMTGADVAGLSATKNILVRKRSAGGSGVGVQPVADADPIAQMVLTSGVGGNCKPTIANPNIYKCNSANTVNLVSDAGISDEEPALFVAPNVPAGESSVSATQIAALDAAPMAALTFGIPVSNNLYAALQVAQGLDYDLDGDNKAEGQAETASAADIQANMPSLTRDQVSNLMKGGTVFWDQVRVGDVSTTAADESVSLIDAAVAAGLPAPQITDVGTGRSRVTICRRVNGSGTQAQMNALFLNVPCSADAEFAAPDTTGCTQDDGTARPISSCTTNYQGYAHMTLVGANKAIVHENSGSGNVTTCLEQLNDAGRWSIGLQSLEKISGKYSFVKLNGVAPTLEKVASGQYFDWAATSMQWRNKAVNGVAAPVGDELAVLKQLRLDFASPAVLDQLNDSFVSHFGPVGFLSLNGAPRPFNVNAPVMQYTRGTAGKSTCNTPKARTGDIDHTL